MSGNAQSVRKRVHEPESQIQNTQQDEPLKDACVYLALKQAERARNKDPTVEVPELQNSRNTHFPYVVSRETLKNKTIEARFVKLKPDVTTEDYGKMYGSEYYKNIGSVVTDRAFDPTLQSIEWPLPLRAKCTGTPYEFGEEKRPWLQPILAMEDVPKLDPPTFKKHLKQQYRDRHEGNIKSLNMVAQTLFRRGSFFPAGEPLPWRHQMRRENARVLNRACEEQNVILIPNTTPYAVPSSDYHFIQTFKVFCLADSTFQFEIFADEEITKTPTTSKDMDRPNKDWVHFGKNPLDIQDDQLDVVRNVKAIENLRDKTSFEFYKTPYNEWRDEDLQLNNIYVATERGAGVIEMVTHFAQSNALWAFPDVEVIILTPGVNDMYQMHTGVQCTEEGYPGVGAPRSRLLRAVVILLNHIKKTKHPIKKVMITTCPPSPIPSVNRTVNRWNDYLLNKFLKDVRDADILLVDKTAIGLIEQYEIIDLRAFFEKGQPFRNKLLDAIVDDPPDNPYAGVAAKNTEQQLAHLRDDTSRRWTKTRPLFCDIIPHPTKKQQFAFMAKFAGNLKKMGINIIGKRGKNVSRIRGYDVSTSQTSYGFFMLGTPHEDTDSPTKNDLLFSYINTFCGDKIPWFRVTKPKQGENGIWNCNYLLRLWGQNAYRCQFLAYTQISPTDRYNVLTGYGRRSELNCYLAQNIGRVPGGLPSHDSKYIEEIDLSYQDILAYDEPLEPRSED